MTIASDAVEKQAETTTAQNGENSAELGADGAATITAGAAMFARLKSIGIDYVFCNSGTDFPPLIEGLAEAAAKDVALPEAIIVPHEHAALGMAHGYYFATGKAQAVGLHTNVGLANGSIGTINANIDQVPMVVFSGRTPVTEKGRFGARTVPIGWGQEMFDQTALVREATKWDYELKFPEQIGELLDRASAIANSTPKGPVYLSLPREVLCEPCPTEGLYSPPSMQPAVSAPDMNQIRDAAAALAGAKNPVIFAQRGAGSPAGFAALSKLAGEFNIPVCQWWAVATAIPTDHPTYVGTDPEPWISEADVVLVVDALAPWMPDVHTPRDDAKIIQIAPDPLFSRTPVRNFRSDLTIVSETAPAMEALADALSALKQEASERIAARAEPVRNAARAMREKADAAAKAEYPMSKAYVSKCLSDAIAGRKDATVLSELGCPLDQIILTEHNSWHQEPHAGGLGWSFPCALGMKLGAPDRLVIATMGDGSYMFANPVACHQIAEALNLPVLIVIVNNAEWAAVRHSVTGLYPDGYAAKANRMPLTTLEPTPDFTKIAEASRAYAAMVEQPDELPAALAKAIRHVEEKKGPALLEVKIA
ncbi:thiamine pyrophosphate-requiring protein [Cucumibacter marinus]|uniref:thiamine pyrophosphate-requiring protein n=1 Tax=Cucumibacter marinus TaxID=1121252 RepID=UPI00041BE27A|nr:thiamine pyrophosphate-requiring protein [Cucumibacter marinus]